MAKVGRDVLISDFLMADFISNRLIKKLLVVIVRPHDLLPIPH